MLIPELDITLYDGNKTSVKIPVIFKQPVQDNIALVFHIIELDYTTGNTF
jgi:hypothetical protein